MAKSNPAAALAAKLIQLVTSLREGDEGCHILTLSQLAQLANESPTHELFRKAVKLKDFTTHVILAQKKNPDSLLVHSKDIELLAKSDTLLVSLLDKVCTPEAPAIEPVKLSKKVEKPLQSLLLTSLNERIESGKLPEQVGVIELKKKRHLFLTRLPPPPPPKAPHVELAEKLLAALESRRAEADGFPWTMGGLLTTAGTADAKLVKKALTTTPLKGRLIAVGKGDTAPVGLVEDKDNLAASGAVLQFALAAARTPTTQIVNPAALKTKLSASFKPAFAEALDQRLARGDLPSGIGCLKIKNQPHLFFFSEAMGSTGDTPPPETATPKPPPVDFASSFEQVFSSLDRQNGSVNLVSLVELRRALPVDRVAFDQALLELRRAGRYSLTAAEGRHGLTAEEQEAAINENGNLLLFVSRR